ncbi:MAG TPA: hypothetical protein VKS82_02135 [Streptosporangiaceae bacterium]|nr:hypothetical protein [Streptosporangiaceae bacterium]
MALRLAVDSGRRLRRGIRLSARRRSTRQTPAPEPRIATRRASSSLLLAVVLIVAAQQPVAGVVFVLDGVLIGAGDQNYLALAGLITTAVFGAAAAVMLASHTGLPGVWAAYSLWLLARFATLTLRSRGSRWLVTGATR